MFTIVCNIMLSSGQQYYVSIETTAVDLTLNNIIFLLLIAVLFTDFFV